MAPEGKNGNAGSLDVPKRSCKMLLFIEKVNILNKERKKKSVHEIVKEKEEIHASFAVTLQPTKVRATVRGKCLVKALGLEFLWWLSGLQA